MAGYREIESQGVQGEKSVRKEIFLHIFFRVVHSNIREQMSKYTMKRGNYSIKLITGEIEM